MNDDDELHDARLHRMFDPPRTRPWLGPILLTLLGIAVIALLRVCHAQ